MAVADIFDGEKTLKSSDGKTYMKYVAAACTVTGFGNEKYDVFYRPSVTKKLTRVGLPLMFPNFSSVKDDKFIECNTYLPKHGIFCREFHDSKMTWTEASSTSNSVTMTAKYSDEHSMKMYPFKFQCDATFTVESNKLIHSLKITNLETDKTLPASPGIHPYFACAQADKGKITLEGGCDFDCSKFNWVDQCPDDNLPFKGSITITIPNKGAVRMTDKSGLYKRIQIWSDKASADDHEFVCFEPVVLGADGLNNKTDRLNIPAGSSVTLTTEIDIIH